MSTSGFIGRMTREQRDLLRKQIDVRMRERLERGRNAQTQARTRYEAGRLAARPLSDAHRVPQP
jgi:hypothetical protein